MPVAKNIIAQLPDPEVQIERRAGTEVCPLLFNDPVDAFLCIRHVLLLIGSCPGKRQAFRQNNA